ncbi:MAG TPA: hypothetical protein VK470_19870 [Bacteroidota bacterium]|nr:hypothetical protein [Bacteroidota bacterium]
MWVITCLVVIEAGLWGTACAQSASDAMVSAPYRTPGMQPETDSSLVALGFDHNAYTYLWNLGIFFDYRSESLYSRVTNFSTRSLMKQSTETVRDANTFSFALIDRLSRPLALRLDAQSFVTSDNQSSSSGTTGQHQAAAGVVVMPLTGVSIAPMIGGRIDRQQEYEDQGPLYRLLVDTDTLDFDGYRTLAMLRVNESDLAPRRFRNDGAEVSLLKDFSNGSLDSMRVKWTKNRWDFYIPADNTVREVFNVAANIRSRTEDAYAITNALQYGGAPGPFSARFLTTVESRSITNAYRYQPVSVLSAIPFTTNVQEFRIEGGLSALYRTDESESALGFFIGERDEKHTIETIAGVDNAFQTQRARQEQRLDNTALTTNLQASFTGQIAHDDWASITASSSMLRYDTPDTLNTDDRDELLMTVTAAEHHRISAYLTIGLEAEATLGHTVYLSRERSANNNWNRIFRLAPLCIATPYAGVINRARFEVLANYTVFDFELVVPTVKSYSYRQVAFLDSFSYDMTRRIGLDAYGQIRVYERGELRWQEFSERPLQQVQEVTFSPQMRFTMKEDCVCAAGIRSFAQKRFRYDKGERFYESTYYSIGPTVSFLLKLSDRSFVELRGWREYQKQTGTTSRAMSNVTLAVRYLL